MSDEENPAPDESDVDMDEALDTLASAVEGATDDALEHLADEADIEDRVALYQEHGFAGEPVTVEVELYDAELYAVMDLLDRVTDKPLPAHQFVPAGSALSALIRASPTGTWSDWITASMAPTEEVDE